MGVDTSAYLNQGGQFDRGISKYKDITTRQGLCFFPAGHLHFYNFIYNYYKDNEHGEYHLKIFHGFMHSAVIVFVSLVAY